MEITTEKLKEKIKNGDKLVVDFHGLWCGPCKIMKPMFEEVSKNLIIQNSKVEFYTFDIDKDREFVMSMGIRGVPTIKAFSDGTEIFSKSGIMMENELNNLANSVLYG